MRSVFNKSFFFALFFLCFSLFAFPVLSAYEKYEIGGTITIGEFVYDDNFQATTSPCSIFIYNPQGGLAVSAAMDAESTGWHHYDFSSADAAGIWPTTIVCGNASSGDLAKLDKTFLVSSSSASNASPADIATAVWGASGRTLSSFGVLAADIWNDAYAPIRRLTDKNLSGGGSLTTEFYIEASSTPAISAAVWANSSRTLSDFGSLVSNIWSNSTRTLTGATLNSGSLALQSDVLDIKSNATALITEIGTGNISAIKTKTDNIAWTDITGLITSNGEIKAKTDAIAWSDITAIKTKADTIDWTDVTGIKAKTDTINWSDISGLPLAVWNYSVRTLTGASLDSGSLAIQSDVASIKTKTDTIAWSDITGLVVSNGDIKAKTDDINWSDVTAIKTKTDTIAWSDITEIKTNIAALITEIGTGNISAIKTKTDTIAWSDITSIVTLSGNIKVKTDSIDWTDVSAIKTKTADIAWSDIAGIKTKTDTIVWGDIDTLKNNIAGLVTEIGTGNISAIKTKTDTIAWSDITGLMTSSGEIMAKTNAIAWSDVTAIKTKTDTISWADVTGIKAKTDTISWSDISGLPLAVWSHSDRTLSSFGTLVADIWDYSVRTLTGASLDSGSLALESDVLDIKAKTDSIDWTAISAIKTKTDTIVWSDITGIVTSNGEIKAKTDTVAWSDISAIKTKTDTIAWSDVAEIKTNVSTLITEIGTGNISAIKTKTDTIAWSDITGLVTSNGEIKAKTDTVAWSDVSAIKTKTDTIAWSDVTEIKAKTDTINWSDIASIPLSVWGYSGRGLTSFGTLVADIWNNPTRTLTDNGNDITAADVWSYAHSGQSGIWTASLMDTESIQAGHDYRAKVYLKNAGQAAAPYSVPRISIYDVSRNVVISNLEMSSIGTGVYEYVYHVADTAVQGNWETVITTEATSGSNLQVSDYWAVEGSPAQVIINSIGDDTVPSIAANVTITNEGLSGYEYQYSWCVVSDINNTCGGGDDVYYASAAKYINPGENWNTSLTANVVAAGNYYFKLIVNFGTDSSSATRSLTAKSSTTSGDNGNNGGGGGGSDSNENVIPIIQPAPTVACDGADFNHDKKVNSIDFSIMLAFWKKDWPFKNSCVDINGDKEVGSVDFSILMYQWGKIR